MFKLKGCGFNPFTYYFVTVSISDTKSIEKSVCRSPDYKTKLLLCITESMNTDYTGIQILISLLWS